MDSTNAVHHPFEIEQPTAKFIQSMLQFTHIKEDDFGIKRVIFDPPWLKESTDADQRIEENLAMIVITDPTKCQVLHTAIVMLP